MTQVATGAGEQAKAIREVDEAITNMDRATQRNAKMVEGRPPPAIRQARKRPPWPNWSGNST